MINPTAGKVTGNAVGNSSPTKDPLLFPRTLKGVVLVTVEGEVVPPRVRAISTHELEGTEVFSPTGEGADVAEETVDGSHAVVTHHLFNSMYFDASVGVNEFPDKSVVEVGGATTRVVSFVARVP